LPADAPELRLSQLLDQYRQQRELRLEETKASKRVRAVASLLVCGLQQRLLSSIEAFARTLRVHRKTAEKHWQQQASTIVPTIRRLDLLGEGVGSDDDRATVSEEELQKEEEAQIEAATGATSGQAATSSQVETERRLLAAMADLADRSRDLPDGRIVKLVEWIRTNMCPSLPSLDDPHPPSEPARWTDVRILIFTEYDDTQRYLKRQLDGLIALTDRGSERIAVYNGPTPYARRRDIQESFNKDPKKDPLRILIATDAGREGINLQSHCCNLFHFDVPWNPSRMEQRNGRIDRKLQPSPEVFCHYFYYRQRAEDRILKRLVEKTETIKGELGSLSQVVEGRLSEVMAGGIWHRDLDRIERNIQTADLDPDRKEAVREELEQARERQDDLCKQIETLRGGECGKRL
jgi:superfamily II DNA/RNA helicase